MVPLRLNFYEYREQVRRALFQRKASLGTKWDPLSAAWLGYAFLQDGLVQNPHMLELIHDLERWAQENVGDPGRYLGPLCFLGYLQLQGGQTMSDVALRALERIKSIDRESRFSPFRAPEQMFLVALLISRLDDASGEAKNLLVTMIQNQLYGPLQRRIMFLAAGKELGLDGQLHIPAGTVPDVGDVIALVWWQERYRNADESNSWWKVFDNMSADISLIENGVASEAGETRIVSPWEIAILYEALVKETINPDPSLLFELYPLHPRIKAITGSLFNKGEYFSAVFEATKVFNDYLRESTGSQESETRLVRNTIGDPASDILNPKIKFNLLDPTSPDYRSQQNEQRGLSYLAHGVFFAFRHPKGHEPQDTLWGNISAYEALAQLVVISYLMKRIEEAR